LEKRSNKQVKKTLYITFALVLALGLLIPLAGCGTVSQSDLSARALDEYYSPGTISTTGLNTLEWTGQGVTDGVLNDLVCSEDNTPYLLWVFTFDGATLSGTPTLTVNGVEQPAGTQQGNNYHFVTDFFALGTLAAYVTFNVTDLPTHGPNNPPSAEMVLTISHGCPGEEPPPPQATLSVVKFYDANANGEFDAPDSFLDGWYFTINGDLYSTPFSDTVDPGDYTIAELMPDQTNWVASTLTSVDITLTDGDDETIYFGNYCLVPSGGLTLGFWSNKNGQKTMDSMGMNPTLAVLASLNLRKANGDNSDPGTYTAFRTWLLGATATNMAYMLSAQLAAMELNVLNGAVDGGAFYVPYGGTINALMAEANAALGSDGYTPAGDPNRGTQEFLKNCLDSLNNGASVIPTAHCPYTFTLPV
jgi:hypothetical protein